MSKQKSPVTALFDTIARTGDPLFNSMNGAGGAVSQEDLEALRITGREVADWCSQAIEGIGVAQHWASVADESETDLPIGDLGTALQLLAQLQQVALAAESGATTALNLGSGERAAA